MTAIIETIASDESLLGHTYGVQVDDRLLHVTIRRRITDPAAGWEALVIDRDLTYPDGYPLVTLDVSGSVVGTIHGRLAGPYLIALGTALTRHFHGA